MPSPPSPTTYTALDAARASLNGAFITAWPAEEPYFAPSMDQLMRDMASASQAKVKAKARAGPKRTSFGETLAQRAGKTAAGGK
ncbi:hypothetical protein E4U55_002277 [Claviceps digitariae]|nr:hypothetical protein E4U55_002277 [Claviceps digitariae]